MKKFKAIIFDMDGVIVDSQAKHHQAELKVFQNHGLDVSHEKWGKFFGWKIEEIFTFLAKKYRKNMPINVMADEKNILFLKLIKTGAKRIPGAINFIKNTQKYFLKTAVATSSKSIQRKMIFNKLGVEKHFDIFIHGEDVKKGKPSPEIYLLAAKKLQFKPSECLVIEDAPNGVLSAKSAGCSVIGILTGFTRQELKIAGADYIVKDYKELGKLIKQNGVII